MATSGPMLSFRWVAGKGVRMKTSRTNVPAIADNATRFASRAISGSAQQRKAQIRKLVKELKVMGRAEITPTCCVSALVRAPGDQVDLSGFEPLTSPVRGARSTN